MNVMMAIRPEWCMKIISGEKTAEVRKKAPNQSVPYKVFIYCSLTGKYLLYRSIETGKYRITENKPSQEALLRNNGHTILNGTVIGEFTCKSILYDEDVNLGILPRGFETCLSDEDLVRYAGFDKKLFYLRISDLVIYRQPRELAVFGLTRPPQSWQYVRGCTE